MGSIPANLLKTQGVSAISEALTDAPAGPLTAWRLTWLYCLY